MTAAKSTKAARPAKKAKIDVGSAIAGYDARAFFEKALAYGVQNGIIGEAQVDAIRLDGPKGIVQIADFFGTAFLRANLEEAKQRIVALASLFLEVSSDGDLTRAAMSLRDYTFLSHSRGGSDMLKKLHLMPKSTLFGDNESEPVKDFLAEYSLHGLRILEAYHQAQAERSEVANSLAAAAWFAEKMGMARSTLAVNSADERYLASAEGVIRTALLLRLSKDASCPNRADFARLVMVLRSKGVPARALKALAAPDAEVPPAYRKLEQDIAKQIVQYDLPKIADQTIALDELLNMLEPRYFLRATGLDEISEYDAMVSAEWHKVMKGKTEADARLTVFLCLAAGVAPKPSISETVARSILRTIRSQGIDSKAVLKFINDCAPFDMKESLIELWQDEFVPDAEVALFDLRNDAKGAAALKFLKENCHVMQAPARKKT
jgi:hypothetical protein